MSKLHFESTVESFPIKSQWTKNNDSIIKCIPQRANNNVNMCKSTGTLPDLFPCDITAGVDITDQKQKQNTQSTAHGFDIIPTNFGFFLL